MKAQGGSTMYMVIGDYIRIIGNWLVNMNTYGATGAFNVDNSRYVYMYGNYFNHVGTDNWQHAVYGKTKSAIQGVDTSFHYFAYNEIFDYRDNLGPHGCGGGMLDYSRESDAGSKTTHHIYIHSNWFRSSGGGIWYTEGGGSYPVHHIYIYNNIISNPTTCNNGADGNFYFDGPVSDFYVFNNTFYKGNNPSLGALLIRYDYGAAPVYFKNNIFVSANNNQPYVVYEGGSGPFNSDHDLYYNSPIPRGSGYNITNAIASDPILINPAEEDYRISASSPAVDAGSSDVSFIVTVDYRGVPRPQGAAYDIGAYEYFSEAGNPDITPPSPPRNLRVIQ